MLTIGVWWRNFWLPRLTPYLAYIQQISSLSSRSLQELISYLKKIIYNSNKTFETSLTSIRRSRYPSTVTTRARILFISHSHDRAWEPYPATRVHTPSRGGRGARVCARCKGARAWEWEWTWRGRRAGVGVGMGEGAGLRGAQRGRQLHGDVVVAAGGAAARAGGGVAAHHHAAPHHLQPAPFTNMNESAGRSCTSLPIKILAHREGVQ